MFLILNPECVIMQTIQIPDGKGRTMMKQYDVAAYVWPAYTGSEMRSRIFWPEGIGEWQTVKNSAPKANGYRWSRKPLWGYVDEADPRVMEQQIEEATRHGVNVFIYDWYWYDRRPFLEQCLNNGFLKAENRSIMKFYLMWANHDANYCWDIRLSNNIFDKANRCNVWDGHVDRAEFDRLTGRIIEKYFCEPNYYKIDGKPVFMIYDVDNLIKGLGGIQKTAEALGSFRRATVAAGYPGLELQLTGWGERISNQSGVDGSHQISTKEIVPKLGFDSVTNYQFVHFCKMNRTYAEVLETVAQEWKRMDQDYSVPYYPHVSIGWDNNPRFTDFVDRICFENTPEMFERGLRMAKEYVDSHPNLKAPLITVNSWNEWTESSYLEPDDVYGYGYLEAIKRVFLDECK